MRRYAAVAPAHVPRIALQGYLRRAFPMLPESVLRAALKARDVKVNGVRAGADAPVPPGAEVALYTGYEAALPIVYEDDRVLALDKPAGVSCDRDAYGSLTAEDWAALYARDYTPRLCHRLDNATSGLLLLAKDEAAETALREMFARHTGEKTYYCILRGTPAPPEAERGAWLMKDAAHARVKILNEEKPGAKPIRTRYAVERSGPVSLTRVTLLTGRTHQIRAHMAFLGHPVLGDDLYGDRAFNRAWGSGSLMLRSWSLRVETGGALPQLDGKTLQVPLRLDESYERILQKMK